MKDYKKITYLQTYCDKQAECSKCPLRNIHSADGSAGLIADWEEETIDMAYKMVFEEEKTLKKILTNRCVVELRNKERYLVVGDFLMGENNYFTKGDFVDNLSHIGLHKLDIVRVYEKISKIEALYNKDLDIIWERKPKKMTKEEIEKALGYEIEIIKEE